MTIFVTKVSFSLVFPSFLCFHNSSKLHLFFFSHLRPWLTGFDGSREKLFFVPFFQHKTPWSINVEPTANFFQASFSKWDMSLWYHTASLRITCQLRARDTTQNSRSNFQNWGRGYYSLRFRNGFLPKIDKNRISNFKIDIS